MTSFGPISAVPISTLPKGAVRPAGPSPFAVTVPIYDLIAAFDTLLPGMQFSPGDWDAMYAAWVADGYVPLTQAQALAYVSVIHGPLPALLTSIPQLAGFDDPPTWFRVGTP